MCKAGCVDVGHDVFDDVVPVTHAAAVPAKCLQQHCLADVEVWQGRWGGSRRGCGGCHGVDVLLDGVCLDCRGTAWPRDCRCPPARRWHAVWDWATQWHDDGSYRATSSVHDDGIAHERDEVRQIEYDWDVVDLDLARVAVMVNYTYVYVTLINTDDDDDRLSVMVRI